MSTPSHSHSSAALRRVNTAYVSVPPSPYSIPISIKPASSHVPIVAHSVLKENTPFAQPHAIMAQLQASSPSLKRKLDNCEHSASHPVASSTKKLKHATPSLVNGSSPSANHKNSKSASDHKPAASNTCTEDYPNGFIYCHQCCKKRDVSDTIHCTFLEWTHRSNEKEPKQRRCINKYCKACLKNRYGEDIEEIRTKSASKKIEPGHVEYAGYVFKCPRCKDMCNCPRCRKSKGLQPTGSLNLNKKSSAEHADGKKSKTKKAAEAESAVASSSSKPKASHTKKVDSKPRIKPIIKWNKLYMSLSEEEGEQRMQIREFVLRFNSVLDPPVPKGFLEDLEQIGGKSRLESDDDWLDMPTNWVGELTVKSVIIGLLGLLANAFNGDIAKHMRNAIKDLKNVGSNLNKIWAVISTLQKSLEEGEVTAVSQPSTSSSQPALQLTIASPSPPPASPVPYNTRNTRSVGDSMVSVLHCGQMVPVIVSLIEASFDTSIIREEIEEGVQLGKDIIRDIREGLRKETERWEKVRSTMESSAKDKAHGPLNKKKRDIHKRQLLALENAQKIVMPEFANRMEPLGRDHEGRIYFALSPGVIEREAAHEFITNLSIDDKQRKLKKKCRVLSEDELKGKTEFSWFLVVWGKKPHDALEDEVDDDQDGADDEEADLCQWWGFWDPETILQVAEYIRIVNNLDLEETSTPPTRLPLSFKHDAQSVMALPEESPSDAPLRELVKGIEDFAHLLEWRSNDQDKYGVLLETTREINGSTESAKGKRKSLGTIPPEQFYGK